MPTETVDSKIDGMLLLSSKYLFDIQQVCHSLSWESPIEKLMFCAFFTCGGMWGTIELPVLKDVERIAAHAKASKKTVVGCQVKVGDYRVDFLVYHHVMDGVPPLIIAVECDGHDFHEKTKEQARRDKERDRALLAAGIITMRFTGSEIWACAQTCAIQVIQFVESETEKRSAPVIDAMYAAHKSKEAADASR